MKLAKQVKDFAVIMSTVDFRNVDKPVKHISEMDLDELQQGIDFYNEEIRVCHNIITTSSNVKEISLHKEKLMDAQIKLQTFIIAHLKLWSK